MSFSIKKYTVFLIFFLFLFENLYAEQLLCGEALVKAMSKETGLAVKKRYSRNEIFKGLTALSKTNIERFIAKLGTLVPAEKSLINKLNNFPLPVIHRTKFIRLKDILNKGFIAKVGDHDTSTAPMYLRAENELFGAFDTVFATVGYPSGDIRYGEVVFVLDFEKMPESSWASRWSGAYYLNQVEKVDVDRKYVLKPEYYRGYASSVVIKKDWRSYFAHLVVSYLRKMGGSVRENMISQLIRSNSREELWSMILNFSLGRMEAKIHDPVPLSWVEALEIPSTNRQEFEKWKLKHKVPIVFR